MDGVNGWCKIHFIPSDEPNKSWSDRGSDFHLDMYDVFVIGKDINAAEDIMYLKFSSLWHLCNIIRNIAAGWIFQFNGDATFNVCRHTIALLCLGVNSLGNLNNTICSICWAIIPEAEKQKAPSRSRELGRQFKMLLLCS